MLQSMNFTGRQLTKLSRINANSSVAGGPLEKVNKLTEAHTPQGTFTKNVVSRL